MRECVERHQRETHKQLSSNIGPAEPETISELVWGGDKSGFLSWIQDPGFRILDPASLILHP